MRSLTLTPIAMAALLALAGPAHAQPAPTTLPVLRPGGTLLNASVAAPSGNTLNVTQTPSATNRGLIEWQSFSIGAQARVNIAQPNAQSVLVNRVVGGPNGVSASEIYGALSANGRVFIVNPAGVMFGPSAQVNTGSLVATTLDLSSTMTDNRYERLMRGDDITLTQAGSGPGVQVMGAADARLPQIQVAEGGAIVLLSADPVAQHGVISAPGGHIHLANGSAATLRPVGTSGFVELLSVQAGEPRSGRIDLGPGSQTLASGGNIVIGGQPVADNSTRGDLITLAGTVSADAAGGSAGTVHVDAGAQGDVTVREGAVISASNTTGPTGTGGQVTLLGRNLHLQRGDTAQPRLLADGATGGGRIVLGDDATRAITLDEGTLVSADATRSGDGGHIGLRAMYHDTAATSPVARTDFGVTEAYGTLRARGGTESGNGGSIETSGIAVSTALTNAQTGTTRRATIDASARAAGGRAGLWTLDPLDVTISNTTSVAVNGSFNPTGPGANVAASDLSAALDAGTNIDISTAAAGTAAGNITFAADTVITRTTGGAPTSLTLRANNNIVVDATTLDASRAGPVNINLFSDLDGNGSGSVLVNNSTLLTAGGTLTISGGVNPATGFARGDAQNAGVAIVASTVDTRSTLTPTLRGDVVLRGQAGAFLGAPAGVAVDSTLTVGNLSIDGRASHGTAVQLSGATLATNSGRIDVRGVATRVDTATALLTGVNTGTLNVQLGTGSLTLAGRGDDANLTAASAVGLRLGDVLISADAASTGTITLAGQSTGGSIGPGIQNPAGGATGLVIRSDATVPTSARTGANVVIGALSDVRATSLELGVSGPGPNIATTGGVNIRPLGVSATGALVEQASVPITLRPTGSNAGATTFVVNTNLLRLPTANNAGISAGGGVVIGSQAHTGAIAVADNAFTQHAGVAVNLQNEGAGSSGITLGSGNTLGNLGLLSAGNVTQTGGLNVQNLVIRGGAASTVTLDAATNQVGGVLAFDPPAALTLRTQGDLTVDAATVRNFDATAGFTPLAITGSVGGNSAVLQAGGNVFVNQSIGMAGTAPQLDIVSPGTVTFATGTTLATGSGRWRVWAPTVVNAPISGGAANLYGCVFGDTTICSVSGITLPAAGNELLHPTQPTLLVTANPATGYADLALPTFTYATTGLVNGDTAGQALAGAPAATPTGTPASYTIDQGSLRSPLGYIVEFTPATLTLRPGVTRHMLQAAFQSEMSSDVYGRNLDQPFVCTAASVIRGGLTTGAQDDPLASEWGKVRNQPQLSGCLNVTDGGQCSAF